MVPTRKTPTDTKPQRILIYGVTGSGKSTLAQAVSRQLDLPLFLVDDLTWLPNWKERPFEEQLQIFTEICAGERWVLDSAYGKWLDVPMSRVELIVGLDLPRWVSLSRLMQRTLLRLLFGETCCNGNREQFRKVFSRESIIAWHFKSFRRKRDRIRAWETQLEEIQVIRLRSAREVEEWLSTLSR